MVSKVFEVNYVQLSNTNKTKSCTEDATSNFAVMNGGKNTCRLYKKQENMLSLIFYMSHQSSSAPQNCLALFLVLMMQWLRQCMMIALMVGLHITEVVCLSKIACVCVADERTKVHGNVHVANGTVLMLGGVVDKRSHRNIVE